MIGPNGTIAVRDDEHRVVVVGWTEDCEHDRVWVADGYPLAATRDGFWVQHYSVDADSGVVTGRKLWLVSAAGEILAPVDPPSLTLGHTLVAAMALTDSRLALTYLPPYAPVTVTSGLAAAPEWAIASTRDDVWPRLVSADGSFVEWGVDFAVRSWEPSGVMHVLAPPTTRGCDDPMLGADGLVLFVCSMSPSVPPPGENVLRTVVVVYNADGTERYQLMREGLQPSSDDNRRVLSRDGTLYIGGLVRATNPWSGRREPQGVLVAVQTDVPGVARDAWARQDRDARSRRTLDAGPPVRCPRPTAPPGIAGRRPSPRASCSTRHRRPFLKTCHAERGETTGAADARGSPGPSFAGSRIRVG